MVTLCIVYFARLIVHLAPPLVIEAASQRYKQAAQLLYTSAALPTETLTSRSKTTDGSVSCGRSSNGSAAEFDDRTTTTLLSLKVRMLKAEVIELETLL